MYYLLQHLKGYQYITFHIMLSLSYTDAKHTKFVLNRTNLVLFAFLYKSQLTN